MLDMSTEREGKGFGTADRQPGLSFVSTLVGAMPWMISFPFPSGEGNAPGPPSDVDPVAL